MTDQRLAELTAKATALWSDTNRLGLHAQRTHAEWLLEALREIERLKQRQALAS